MGIKINNIKVHIAFAAVGGIPTAFAWAIGEALFLPMMLSLGVSANLATMVWVVSPVIGLGLHPVLGRMSDNCKSSLGRRRPFFMVYSLLGVVCLSIVGFGPQIGEYLSPDHPKLATSFLSFFAYGFVDLSHDLLLVPGRALVNDLVPEHDNTVADIANSYYTLASGFGALSALAVTSSGLFPLHWCFIIAAIITVAACIIMMVFVTEEPLQRIRLKSRHSRSYSIGTSSRRNSVSTIHQIKDPFPEDDEDEGGGGGEDDVTTSLLGGHNDRTSTASGLSNATPAKKKQQPRRGPTQPNGEKLDLTYIGLDDEEEDDHQPNNSSNSKPTRSSIESAAAAAVAELAAERLRSTAGQQQQQQRQHQNHVRLHDDDDDDGDEYHNHDHDSSSHLDNSRQRASTVGSTTSQFGNRHKISIFQQLKILPPQFWTLWVSTSLGWMLYCSLCYFWTSYIAVSLCGGDPGNEGIGGDAKFEYGVRVGSLALVTHYIVGLTSTMLLPKMNALMGTRFMFYFGELLLGACVVPTMFLMRLESETMKIWIAGSLVTVGGMFYATHNENPYVLLEQDEEMEVNKDNRGLMTAMMNSTLVIVQIFVGAGAGWLVKLFNDELAFGMGIPATLLITVNIFLILLEAHWGRRKKKMLELKSTV